MSYRLSEQHGRPRILQVETGYAIPATKRNDFEIETIDYSIYDQVPHVWRSIEKFLTLDLYLAFKVRSIAKNYDIIWAGSEKVGIPLSFMGVKQPLVVIAHHPESFFKAKFLRLFKVTRKWSGIGYISESSKRFFVNYLKVPEESLFQYFSAAYLDKIEPAGVNRFVSDSHGGIVCAGVAKRDYKTLISALADLEGYKTKLFVSSKYGDTLQSSLSSNVPNWIDFQGFVPEEELIHSYKNAQFVVVPLKDTTHTGAGISSVLEAAACGKAVIATNSGGMDAIIKHGETGLLVPPNDPAALRDAIQQLWTQPDLAEKMGIANREFVETYFNPKAVNGKINRFLLRLLKIDLGQLQKAN